jgi:DHA2 family multidrug resistance protein
MTTLSHPAAATAARPLSRGMVTLSIMLATVMQALDTTIANVALPHMQGSLQASQDQIVWVLTSYIVAAAIATPMTGWLCGRWGQRQVLLISVVGFTVSSALCGLAGSLWQIVVARLLQGVFGAALVPLSQSVLLDINPREKHGQAMAVWGAGVMVGPVLGPMLGGWLTEAFDWRYVFFINLPIGVLAFYGIARYLPENRPRRTPLDLFGFIWLSLAVGLLQMFLDRGADLDWLSSTEIRLEALGAVVALAVFAAHTLTAEGDSFVDRALLRDRNFVAGSVVGFMVGLILYGTMALLPTLLQGLMGYSVVMAGELMAPRGLGTMVSMMSAGWLLKHFGTRTLMTIGFGLMAVALYSMSRLTLQADGSLVMVSGFVQGVGTGLSFVPMSTITFATLAPRLRPQGTPIFSLLRNLGGSVGISLIQTLLTHRTVEAHARLVENINVYNPVLQALPPEMGLQTPQGIALLAAEINRQAGMIGYVDDFRIMMAITLLALPLLLLMRPPGRNAAPVQVDPGH